MMRDARTSSARTVVVEPFSLTTPVTLAHYGEVGDVAWTVKDGLDCPAPVATKRLNAFGLHDMLGKVWE
ncbi:SUMF1/EgtB/PvdO family nonheme iron enzyme [Actinomyces wuliandei]|uniref:SUMF1/EgtB/PvdO family nonheme iron enzyme n=1 Tax=Actinomyces wuliandei TaxID=2057743 RepID=UPI0019D4249F|nr:SUMF1/EgtB/PvdO family nonheme iron enzyme [Actinomyces wuliandei]